MDTQARPTTRAVPRLAPRLWLAFAVLAVAAAMAALRPAAAQDNLATSEELRELVGPIALYPDDLVAIVLPASTYPLQVVQAARFLEDRKVDSSLKPSEDWDDSVVALLNYPEVIELLNDDLDWTYDLGTAVLNQRADVLSAIQAFRDEAYDAGNLRSDERQTISRVDDAIEIKPADPQVIYVPYYEPEHVVVYQSAPVYYYYPVAYPVYYYPYPSHYHFHTGFFWGVNTWFSIGWHSHYLHAYDPFYYGHPYYGRTYYDPYYVRNVYVNVNNYRYPNYVWEPRYRYGGRPVTRSSEGRVYNADGGRPPHHGALDSNATRTREGTVDRAREGAAPSGTQPPASAQDRTRNTPNGRSTLARPPPGRSTQANEGSNGRSTRAQTPPGQTHGQTHQPVRTQPRESNQAQTSQPGASSAPPSSTNRSGGGMSQAQRSRATTQPNAGGQTSPGAQRANPSMARANPGVSPRASEGSTGMPRESSRSAPPRQQSAPPPRQQSFDGASRGGGMSSQRSEPAGGSHGNAGGHDGGNRGNSGGNDSGSRGNSGGGNAGGGSYRGGGGGERSHGEGRHTR